MKKSKEAILNTLCTNYQQEFLYGSDGATIEQCEELLNDLTKYKVVCEKLKVDNEDLITECKFYYSAYKSYLTIYKNYSGFATIWTRTKVKNNGTQHVVLCNWGMTLQQSSAVHIQVWFRRT